MSSLNIYMDYNATTPVRDEVEQVYRAVTARCYGNASSAHFAGRESRSVLDEARETIAGTIGARPREIVFTSGGTEGNNLAIKGIAQPTAGGHVITARTEHPAVLETCRYLENSGIDLTCLDVDRNGLISPDAVEDAIRQDTKLVTIMWVNNETGVIQPIDDIARRAARHGVPFHTDAVQAYGRLPIDVQRTHVDALTISGHKFCAPKGVGALYVRDGVEVTPILHGGGQERGVRSGTYNVPGAAAIAEAARLANEELEIEMLRQRALRDHLEHKVLARISESTVNGVGAERVPNTSNIQIAGADGEAVLIALDAAGIAASSASACAASHSDPSHVLIAMGLSRRQAEDSMRFSIGRLTTEGDVEHLLDILPGVVERVRSVRADH